MDYASSNFLAMMIHDVFGLAVDVPTREVAFRPVVPWSGFTWSGAHVGAGWLDLDCTDDGTTITAALTNRNAEMWMGTVEITVPTGKVLTGADLTGRRYTRDALASTEALAPGATLTLTANYGDYPSSACVSDAWNQAISAHDAIPTTSWDADTMADTEDDEIPEGYAIRLLCKARCADAGVETAYQANLPRCTELGWGTDWATVCAEYGTISSGLAEVMRSWNGRDVGLTRPRSITRRPAFRRVRCVSSISFMPETYGSPASESASSRGGRSTRRS